jgi:sec-independent protein translocase protein TatA
MFMNPLKDSLGLIVIVVIVLVIFGPNQLPKLAKMFGKTMKGARDAMEGKYEDEADAVAQPVKAVVAEKEAPPE